jgi:hypothetical protein
MSAVTIDKEVSHSRCLRLRSSAGSNTQITPRGLGHRLTLPQASTGAVHRRLHQHVIPWLALDRIHYNDHGLPRSTLHLRSRSHQHQLTNNPQLALEIFLLEETYPPIILVNKATELRRRTRNWGIHAKQEEIEVDLRELLEKNLSRPLRLLYTEPIILAVSVYMAFVYGIFYLFLTFYPIVFQRIHGMNEGVGGVS